MSDEIMLVFGEDGVAREYDDTWDITIHCESEEEQKVVLKKLNNSNQEAKAQLPGEGTTSDLISRQDAIEVIEEMQMPIMRSMFPEEQFVFKGMSEALSAIKDLPSAHPEIEERTAEFAQNVPKEDLISRKAAIDAECEVCQIAPKKERGHNCTYYVHGCKEIECLRALPSAQPEPCKDAVSRADVVDMLEMFPFTEYSEYETAREVVKRLPSVQPEIIRCKYCKYCDRGIDEDGNPFLKCLGWAYGGTQEEDFCSHAERRTDDL